MEIVKLESEAVGAPRARNRDSCGLDALPVEVIQRIAFHGDGESVLTLSTLNRLLRSACYDRVVLRKLITPGSSPGLQDEKHRASQSWAVPLDATAPAPMWARWALADSRAVALKSDCLWRLDEVEGSLERLRKNQARENARLDIDFAFTALPSSTFRWLPTLMAIQRRSWHLPFTENQSFN